jgi:hypothetical protein
MDPWKLPQEEAESKGSSGWGAKLTSQDGLVDIRGYIGGARYDAARVVVWAQAPTFGLSEVPLGPLHFLGESVPHDIADEIWYTSALSDYEKIRLTFEIFVDLPSYGLMMYTTAFIEDMTAADREFYWSNLSGLLDSEDDHLAAPIEYLLFEDILADMEIAAEAWTVLTADLTARVRVTRVLGSAGMAPLCMKADVYERLIEMSAWGRDLVSSDLLQSALEIMGDFDVTEGARISALLDQYDD